MGLCDPLGRRGFPIGGRHVDPTPARIIRGGFPIPVAISCVRPAFVWSMFRLGTDEYSTEKWVRVLALTLCRMLSKSTFVVGIDTLQGAADAS